MARRTSRPGALIAARRLADDPRAGFRAVSGLVLALFVTTVAVADDHHPGRQEPRPDRRHRRRRRPGGRPGRPATARPAHGRTKPAVAPPRQLPASLLTAARRIGGVRGVIAVRAGSALTTPATHAARSRCSRRAWSRAPSWPAFPPWAAAPRARRRWRSRGSWRRTAGQNLDRITWPAENVSGRQPGGVDGIDVATNGSQSAVEQARTVLENANAYPTLGAPYTLGRAEHDAETRSTTPTSSSPTW